MLLWQSRLEALNQILEMLSTQKEKSEMESTSERPGFPFTSMVPIVTSTTLLNSVHQQFLTGCFGLGALNTDLTSSSQLYHYQVGLLCVYFRER